MKEMGKSRKRSQQINREESESGSEFDSDEMLDDMLPNGDSNGDIGDYSHGDEDKEEEGNSVSDDGGEEEESNYGSHDTGEEDDDDDDDEDEEGDDEREGWKQNEEQKNAEMEVLENEYRKLQHKEKDLLSNLTSHKDEDILKGEAVKNQKVLWDKTLELRFLLQKAFSNSNRLPQEPIKSSFYGDEVSEAYSDLIGSSKKTLDSILELQEALLEKNPSITQSTDGFEVSEASHQSIGKSDEEWLQITQMHSRMSSFRDKSVDKWQRRTQVTSGAAAVKGKLHAFNQSISQQVGNYMRDPSKMIKGMQLSRSAVALFGTVPDLTTTQEEGINADGNPELLDDSDFYQQLLKEFFETIDPTSSDKAFYTLKRLQTKKRKIVDRRASKSRKIRYNVHEKIVNFMAAQPMELPPMAPKLFENLFGFRTQIQAAG
ncbi:PREDICTED: protein AATF-like isoform X2 [Ipomoea nil]|uniref:protein AATF-like isoform X2 n=1 Tax=Ipomoea nil TaxID=35883 RepID=UPI0009017E5B|nr:PREDICTED: protein AATF-like isoform X2 [Ipomoea nil]